MKKNHAVGQVVQAFGNLIHVRFEGNIRQGEMAHVKIGNESLLAEVIEIAGKDAKLQVFEDTRGIKLHTPVEFHNHLLEAELGPGLLTSIFDGLQNPLEGVASETGVYLKRGVYLPPLDRKKMWDFTPTAKPGDILKRGDSIGYVQEERFQHTIMVPFSHFGTVKIGHVARAGSYSVDTVLASGEAENGRPVEIKMYQKWPVKNSPLPDDGYGSANFRYPISHSKRGVILFSRPIWSW